MNKFQDLYNFIDRAVKNRKYVENTSQTLKAALNLYRSELNEDEQNSLEIFEKKFEEISQSVFSKNQNRFNASSLASYKSRTMKVLKDFQRYGADPIKMNNWVVRSRKNNFSKKSVKDNKVSSIDGKDSSVAGDPSNSISMHRIELSLRPDAKFVLIVPRDITVSESETIKTILGSLVHK